jgi:hypothetical protein
LLLVLVATAASAADETITTTPATIPASSISYAITVELNPVTRELDGHETITWTNTLEEPVAAIPMHLLVRSQYAEFCFLQLNLILTIIPCPIEFCIRALKALF